MRQILINLLNNAIKFTERGNVRLAVRHADDDPLQLHFDVVDTGIGLTAAEAGRLFQPFSQADGSTTRRFGGTGLGLTISRCMARALGGDVVLVSSQPGLGSTFRLILPAGPVDLSPSNLDAASPHEARIAKTELLPSGLRILLAEDGPDNQRLITWLLNRAGVEVTAVENGKGAVEAALTARQNGEPFDIVLMDMQMPVMDGFHAAHLLREEAYAGPIIALTASAMAGDKQKCLDAGCDDYVAKPIDRDALFAAIGRTIPSGKKQRSRVQRFAADG